jgi:hypothetical protein
MPYSCSQIPRFRRTPELSFRVLLIQMTPGCSFIAKPMDLLGENLVLIRRSRYGVRLRHTVATDQTDVCLKVRS